MGRKTQITKEQMLEAGLRMIIRDGYASVSMKTVAAELHCSTQPIAWSFGNIDSYKKELRKYAMAYMNRKMMGDGSDPVADHRRTGDVYVDMAIDEPNLIRYLRSDEEDLRAEGGIGFIFDEEKNKVIRKNLAQAFNTTEENALAFIQFVTTYTEGVVSMILSGVISPDKETAHRMVGEAGAAYTVYLQMKEQQSSKPKL